MNEASAMLRAENKADKFIETFKSLKNYDKLNELSMEELQELNKMVVGMMKKTRNTEGSDIKSMLSIGDSVLINSPKAKDKTFEVVKLNPKKAVVKNSKGAEFTCPYSLITLT